MVVSPCVLLLVGYWLLLCFPVCLHSLLLSSLQLDVLDTHSKWLPLTDFYSCNEANIFGSLLEKLALTWLDLSETLSKSVATLSIVALSISYTSPIPIPFSALGAPFLAYSFCIFYISILPYYSINSATDIYPPPTLITSLPLISLAMIFLRPNMYCPGPSLFTGSVHPAARSASPNISSIWSPLTALYLTAVSTTFDN